MKKYSVFLVLLIWVILFLAIIVTLMFTVNDSHFYIPGRVTGFLSLISFMFPLAILVKYFKLFPKSISIPMIIGCTGLWIMYFLWLKFNFGLFYPQLSALGFNVSEILLHFGDGLLTLTLLPFLIKKK